MKTLSVLDYAKLKGVSDVTVYRWIEKKKVNYTVENVEGREIKKILVNDEEFLSSNTVTTPVDPPVVNVTTASENPTVIEPEDVIASAQSQLLELLNRMYEDNKVLAESAGQTKLLTDSENKTKQQYFEIVQENKILLKENSRLEATTSLMKEQLEKSKKELQEKAELKAKLDLKDQQLKELQEKLKQNEILKSNNWWSRKL